MFKILHWTKVTNLFIYNFHLNLYEKVYIINIHECGYYVDEVINNIKLKLSFDKLLYDFFWMHLLLLLRNLNFIKQLYISQFYKFHY